MLQKVVEGPASFRLCVPCSVGLVQVGVQVGSPHPRSSHPQVGKGWMQASSSGCPGTYRLTVTLVRERELSRVTAPSNALREVSRAGLPVAAASPRACCRKDQGQTGSGRIVGASRVFP